MTTGHRGGHPGPGPAPESSGEGPADAEGQGPQTQGLEMLSMDELKAKVVEAREDAQRNWQHFLHSAADLENYKKHALRERQDAVERTRRQTLSVALGVVDNLDRAVSFGGAHEDTSKALLDGLRMAQRQALDQLASIGVRPIDAVGKPFDPRLHEAVGVVPPQSASQGAGTIVNEVQRGYMLNDDVLRPAKVMVAEERGSGERMEGSNVGPGSA